MGDTETPTARDTCLVYLLKPYCVKSNRRKKWISVRLKFEGCFLRRAATPTGTAKPLAVVRENPNHPALFSAQSAMSSAVYSTR